MFRQYPRDQRDQHIGQRRFEAVRSFYFHRETVVHLEQAAGIRIARHKKVRNRRPALGRARGHEPPHRSQGLDLSGSGLRFGLRRSYRRRCGRRTRGFRRIHDVLGENLSSRA